MVCPGEQEEVLFWGRYYRRFLGRNFKGVRDGRGWMGVVFGKLSDGEGCCGRGVLGSSNHSMGIVMYVRFWYKVHVLV